MPISTDSSLPPSIREHPRCQRTAIIFISAIHLADVDLMRGYQMGAVDYVPGFDGVSSLPFNLLVPSFQCGVSRCFGSRSSANGFMAMLEDFRLVSVSPELQPFPPSPAAALCPSLDTHDSRSIEQHYAPMLRDCSSCLHAHYVIGQDQDNRRIGTRPNQGREPPLVWSVEFMKKVHVASNDTAPLVFPFGADVQGRGRCRVLPWWR